MQSAKRATGVTKSIVARQAYAEAYAPLPAPASGSGILEPLSHAMGEGGTRALAEWLGG